MSHIVYIGNVTLGPNVSIDTPISTRKGHGPDDTNVFVDILLKYYSIFLVCFGTVGNGLSLAVLSRKTFRSSPIGIYLRWLALSDLTALYTGAVYFWAKAYLEYDIRNRDSFSCRFHRWFSYTSVDMSSWILILVTVARLISILYPLRTVCTRVVAYVALFVTLVAALAANLPMFIFYGNMKTYPNGYTSCRYFSQYKFFITEVWSWVVLVKFGFLPVVILIILNTILCIRVFRSSKEMKKMNGDSYTVQKTLRKKENSSRFGYMIHRMSGRRLMKYAAASTRKLNIYNTDITRITTTGDLDTSLLQSTMNSAMNSAMNSRYASKEELKKELNETYGIGQDTSTTALKPQNDTTNSTEKEENNRGRSFIRFAKHMFNTKIRNRKAKYSFSSSTENKDNNLDDDNKYSKQSRPLSTASDSAVLERSRNSSRSLCYDSRNSFHFARDSLQYTKEKRKVTATVQEREGLVPCTNEENNLEEKDQNTTVCNNDLKRPTPIFTISSVGDDKPSDKVVISDLETSMEVNDTHLRACSDISKPVADGHECYDDSYLCEQSDDSETEENLEDSEVNAINKNKIPPPINNTSFDKTTPDVTDNLRAASIKLQHISLNPHTDFTSHIPLHNLNKRQSSENYDSQPEDAGSDTSNRSTGLLVNHSNSNPSGKISPGRLSPSMVSNGLLTPRGKDSQLTGSRHSLNAAVVRTSRACPAKAKTRNLTATLLVINLVFIICNIPIVIYMTSRKYLFANDRSANSPGKTFEIVSNMIMYTNNASNFIMYCLTGTRFRVELKAMLREACDLVCGRRRRRKWSMRRGGTRR